MAHEKQYKLADAIIEKTAEDKIEWKETFDESAFEASLKEYTIKISMDVDFNSDVNYLISILNKDGKLIEVFSDEDLDKNGKHDYYCALRDAYELIRRKTKGIEKALDDILDELKSDDEIPF